MVGQTAILGRPITTLEGSIQPCFQLPLGHRQPVSTDTALLAAIAQLQSLLQNLLHSTREL